MSSPNAALFFDEVCHEGCVKGTASCGKPFPGCHFGASAAYGMASQLGLLNVSACEFPPGHPPSVLPKNPGDGVCTARYCAEPCPLPEPPRKNPTFWDDPKRGAAKLAAQDFGV